MISGLRINCCGLSYNVFCAVLLTITKGAKQRYKPKENIRTIAQRETKNISKGSN